MRASGFRVRALSLGLRRLRVGGCYGFRVLGLEGLGFEDLAILRSRVQGLGILRVISS